MKKLFFTLALTASLVSASAQFGGAPNTGINATMLKMFGDTKAFSAKATARPVSPSPALIVDLRRMNRVIHVDGRDDASRSLIRLRYKGGSGRNAQPERKDLSHKPGLP